MGSMSRFFNQWRKPTGWSGRVLARVFNFSHSKGTNWGLKRIAIEKNFTVLDVGCGGGGTVSKLARIATKGKIYGIDFSEDCVNVSRRTNRHGILTGRVEILQASVTCMPFPDRMFDLVTAVNSHYYWPNLSSNLQEVLRILKPGGYLALIGESYKGGKFDERDRRFVEWTHLTSHSVKELGEIVSKAGFSNIKMLEEYDKGWICSIGRKPA